MSGDLKDVWVMRNPTGHVHVITEMDPTGGDPLAFGWTVTRETLLTPAQAAVVEAARADTERLDWLESARHVCLFFDVDTNSHVTTIRDGVDGARVQRGATAKTIRSALDAALAVQP